MTDHPIFVPFEDDHVSAVLTLPATEPRGLVLMMRDMRGRLAARTAWALADAGIASVRLDMPGSGDSTGSYRSGREISLVALASAALDVAHRATGIKRVVIFGYCQAAAMAVSAAAELPTVSAVLIVVRGGAFKGARPGGPRSASSLFGALRRLARPARRAIGRLHGRETPDRAAARAARLDRRRDRQTEIHPRHTLMRDLARAARTTDILALYVGHPRAAVDVERRVARYRDSVADVGHRFEVRRTTTIPRGFRVPYDRLDEVAATLAGWLDEVIDRPLAAPGPADALPAIGTAGSPERVA